MAIKFSCGSCGKRFAASEDHIGRRSKCPGCGAEIVVTPAVAAEAGMPPKPAVPPAIPSAPDASPMLPRSTAAAALGRRPPLRAILAGSLAANLLLASIGAYQARPRVPEYGGPTGDYRDVLLQMTLWPKRDKRFGMGPAQKFDEVQRKSREFYSEMIRSMPPGEEGIGLLVDAADLFKEDVLDMWIQCRSCSQMLAHDGIQNHPDRSPSGHQ